MLTGGASSSTVGKTSKISEDARDAAHAALRDATTMLEILPHDLDFDYFKNGRPQINLIYHGHLTTFFPLIIQKESKRSSVAACQRPVIRQQREDAYEVDRRIADLEAGLAIEKEKRRAWRRH
jgi:hypothetical protein